MENWWKISEEETKGKNKMHTLQLRLKELEGKIKNWNREEFGNIQKDQEKLQLDMRRIQQQIIEEGRTDELA